MRLIMAKVEIVPAEHRTGEFLSLVREYTNSIRSGDAAVASVLASQHLDAELQDLGTKYGGPGGRMYLALVDGKAEGCAALTAFEGDACEIKRLYVRPHHRGLHIGEKLAQKVIEDARAIGYRHMLLDTFPFMETAIHLYRKLEFYEIPRYNGNPAEEAVFFKKDL